MRITPTPCPEPPPDGHRDGTTYNPYFDYKRLNKQARLVWDVVKDGGWYTADEIRMRTGIRLDGSITARLRDLRKQAFGGHNVERRHLGNGLWMYRVAPKTWDE